ncbi:MAG: phosphatidate cytidylyltransferase [Acidobacteriales bacterium]|nr:phosphatidate cytidylyltransferase [Terriglobales bacterium]
MKRVLTAVVLIPLVLLILFKAPMWIFTLTVGLVAVAASAEYLGMIAAQGEKPFRMAILFSSYPWSRFHAACCVLNRVQALEAWCCPIFQFHT